MRRRRGGEQRSGARGWCSRVLYLGLCLWVGCRDGIRRYVLRRTLRRRVYPLLVLLQFQLPLQDQFLVKLQFKSQSKHNPRHNHLNHDLHPSSPHAQNAIPQESTKLQPEPTSLNPLSNPPAIDPPNPPSLPS